MKGCCCWCVMNLCANSAKKLFVGSLLNSSNSNTTAFLGDSGH